MASTPRPAHQGRNCCLPFQVDGHLKNARGTLAEFKADYLAKNRVRMAKVRNKSKKL